MFKELINDQTSCKLIFFKIIHTKVLKASVSMPLLGGNELPEDELSFIKIGVPVVRLRIVIGPADVVPFQFSQVAIR